MHIYTHNAHAHTVDEMYVSPGLRLKEAGNALYKEKEMQEALKKYKVTHMLVCMHVVTVYLC